jgi:hypothetical protein
MLKEVSISRMVARGPGASSRAGGCRLGPAAASTASTTARVRSKSNTICRNSKRLACRRCTRSRKSSAANGWRRARRR